MDRLPPSSIAGQATFTGCLARITIAGHVLRSLLPPTVRLPDADSPQHPCLLVFGDQRDGATLFGGVQMPWGISYHELMIAIPSVRWDGAAGEHLFVSGMICDFWPAVWNGNYYYGFNKRHASMRWRGDRFIVDDSNGNAGFTADVAAEPMASSAAFDWIRTAAALSVLGHRGAGLFVRTKFDWSFADATIESATVSLVARDRSLEFPFQGQFTCRDACRIERMRWRLGWPEPAPHA